MTRVSIETQLTAGRHWLTTNTPKAAWRGSHTAWQRRALGPRISRTTYHLGRGVTAPRLGARGSTASVATALSAIERGACRQNAGSLVRKRAPTSTVQIGLSRAKGLSLSCADFTLGRRGSRARLSTTAPPRRASPRAAPSLTRLRGAQRDATLTLTPAPAPRTRESRAPAPRRARVECALRRPSDDTIPHTPL